MADAPRVVASRIDSVSEDARRQIITDFLQRVKARAERTIEETNVVTGAHWNALRVVAQEMGVETDI